MEQTEETNPSYASGLSENLMRELMTMLEAKLKKYNEVAQLFIIQYTYFELVEDKWIMKTFLDIGRETLQRIYLSISEHETTYIKIYARNPNFGTLKIHNLLDMRGKSKPGVIYACDLYHDFEPEHFYGKCFTDTSTI